jgi:hypothetical protein
MHSKKKPASSKRAQLPRATDYAKRFHKDWDMLRNLMVRGYFSAIAASFNPALNLAPFSRWTLRDKAAQRRLALR